MAAPTRAGIAAAAFWSFLGKGAKMFPVLTIVWGVKLYTYGLFLALGFWAAVTVAKAEGRRYGVAPERITDLFLVALISALAGSRLFYAATAPEIFLADPMELLRIWKGGLVFYGGFLMAVLACFVYTRIKEMPPGQTADIVAPALAAGQAVGRLGCFFAGCCYGKPSHLPWAVTFTHPETLAPRGIALHPTQLYHAGANLIIFLVLWRLRKGNPVAGRLFLLYVLLYGVTRAFLETFRGDDRGPVILGVFSVSQVIGISAAALALAGILILNRQRENLRP